MADLQSLDVVARMLDLPLEQAEELVVQGVLPEAKGRKGKHDVLACVRAYAAHLRGKLSGEAIGWPEARRLVEEEGWTYTAVARRLQVSPQAVQQRARKEQWVNKVEVMRATQQAAIADFVKGHTDAVLQNLELKHGINRDLLTLGRRHVDGMLRNEKADLHALRALRFLAQFVRAVESVDAAMAGLRDAAWRKGVNKPRLDIPDDVDFDWYLSPDEEKVEEEPA